MTSNNIIIKSISGIPEINSGDNIAKIIIQALKKNRIKLQNKDVIVITQKIISKSENRLIHKNNVIPKKSAIKLSKSINKNPILTQLILNESKRIIQKKPGEYEEIHAKADRPILVVIPKNVPTAHINVHDGVSRILALADIAWRPNDGEMKNVSFDDYDWDKWKKSVS